MLHTPASTPPTSTSQPAARLSLPRVLLHLEGVAVFAASIAIYADQGAGFGWRWITFVALLLVPDLAFVAYTFGKATGARVYNVAHLYALPVALAVAGLLLDGPAALQIALIWLAHIGMDRAVGYGFKYAAGFNETHMHRV